MGFCLAVIQKVLPPVNPDFQDAPESAFVSAFVTPIVVCPDCDQPLTPIIAIRSMAAPTGVMINCPCGKLWRIGFQPIVQVAEPSKIQTVSSLPNGLDKIVPGSGPVSRGPLLHT